uniref:uncharacterized protein LOC122585714 n=1 Tax=Erigeron canadensis TaxID=72917 RepID=UPI001CB8C5F0|nr:uncharacterized protein LOC122585714 [Erigeron canadensis]
MRMEEATGLPPQRRRIATTQQQPSSLIKRKPLANITNNHTVIPNNSNKKKKKIVTPSPTTASDSSIGSTPNPIRPVSQKSRRSDHAVGNENSIVYAQRNSKRNTRSKTKADVSSYQTSSPETRNSLKERSAPVCSSNLNKVKDQGKVNQSDMVKTINDGNKLSVTPRHSSVENLKDKRNTIDVPSGAHHMLNVKNSKETPIRHSTMKRKDNTNTDTSATMHDSLMKGSDKGKETAADYSSIKNVKSNRVDDRVPLKGVIIKDSGEMDTGSNRADLDQRNEGRAVVTPNSLTKTKDKGKAIDVSLDFPSLKSVKRYIMEDHVPLKGVIIKDTGENATGSSCVDLAKKDERKMVNTPTNHHNLEKKDKRNSCPPLLRATSNRNVAEGAQDKFRSKPQTEPPPKKKMRRCSSKEEYALPQDYLEQQRAYFKEIDDFELEVEEV